MNPDTLKTWAGQGTTGQGFTLLAALIAGVVSHQITPDQAVTGLLPAIILIVWPEKAGLAAAAAPVLGDVGRAIEAYNLGMRHGAATTAPQAPAQQAPAPAVAR